MGTKKVCFGTLSVFAPKAQAELIDCFRESLPNPPFVSYDRELNLFSLICERDDRDVVSTFIGHVKAYIDHPQHKERNFVESPKLYPLEGTTIKDVQSLDEMEPESNGLLEDFDEDDTDSEDNEAPHGMSHITTYWTPHRGTIDSLTKSVAESIARLTGASLYPEPERKRVKIQGVNFKQALQKLRNLEDLLPRLALQRSEGSMKPYTNILMLGKKDDDTKIEFVLVELNALAAARIIVSEAARDSTREISLGQLRNRERWSDPFVTPDNLIEDKIWATATTETRESSIWITSSYSSIGNPATTQPVEVSKPAPAVDEQVNLGKYVTQSKVRDIKLWTRDIAHDMNPDSIPVEPPLETAQAPPSGRIRRLKIDSDDEDELEPSSIAALQSGVDTVKSPPAAGSRGKSQATHSPVSAIDDTNSVREVGEESDPKDEKQPVRSILAVVQTNTAATDPVSRTEEEAFELPGVGVISNPETQQVRPVYDAEASLLPATPPRSTETETMKVSPNKPQASIALRGRTGTVSANQTMHSEILDMSPLASHLTTQADLDPTRHGKPVPVSALDAGSEIDLNRTHHHRVPHSRSEVNQSPSGRGITLTSRNTPRGSSRAVMRGTRDNTNIQPRGSRLYMNYGVSHLHNNSLSRARDLIQLDTAFMLNTVAPPPGFDFRVISPFSHQDTTRLESLIDEPLQNIQMPAIKASIPSDPRNSFSVSTPVSSNVSSQSSGKAYVNTNNPKRNIKQMEIDRVAELNGILAQRDHEARSAALKRSTERKQQEDEPNTRCFHNTMKQKASKPGRKGKKGQKNESEKEKRERIQRAKDEAFGLIPPPKASSKLTPVSNPDLYNMSAAKMKALKKNPEIDHAASALVVKRLLISEQTDRLVDKLQPLFEAGRAFSGDLKFEVQLGQILVSVSKETEGQLFTIKGWEAMFNPSNNKQPGSTSFTNILTTNGADVDRILEMKPMGSRGPLPMWNRANPGPSSIRYEFHCQSKENEQFWLVLDRMGNHYICKAEATVGAVNLHYPGQIWDARAVLHGTSNFNNTSEEISDAAARFVDSIHVPEQQKISITYRQPDENEITVRNVVVKRISLHHCHILDRQDFQIQITEVKKLFHRFHQKDKKLSQSFEKPFLEMLKNDRIHYEVSLVHKGINDVLAQNIHLELGELTNETTTGKVLLTKERIQQLVELTSHVVSKIDWAGALNDGTVARQVREEQRRQATKNPTRTLLVSEIDRIENIWVPGVRMNTDAQLTTNRDGQLIKLGYGGAEVPVVPVLAEHEQSQVAAEDLRPDDSASQVGRPGMITTHVRARDPRDPTDRGAGFW